MALRSARPTALVGALNQLGQANVAIAERRERRRLERAQRSGNLVGMGVGLATLAITKNPQAAVAAGSAARQLTVSQQSGRPANVGQIAQLGLLAAGSVEEQEAEEQREAEFGDQPVQPAQGVAAQDQGFGFQAERDFQPAREARPGALLDDEFLRRATRAEFIRTGSTAALIAARQAEGRTTAAPTFDVSGSDGSLLATRVSGPRADVVARENPGSQITETGTTPTTGRKREETKEERQNRLKEEREFKTGEREAGEAFRREERVGGEGFRREERVGGEGFRREERVAGEGFRQGERVSDEEFRAIESEKGRVAADLRQKAGFSNERVIRAEKIAQETVLRNLSGDAKAGVAPILESDRDRFQKADTLSELSLDRRLLPEDARLIANESGRQRQQGLREIDQEIRRDAITSNDGKTKWKILHNPAGFLPGTIVKQDENGNTVVLQRPRIDSPINIVEESRRIMVDESQNFTGFTLKVLSKNGEGKVIDENKVRIFASGKTVAAVLQSFKDDDEFTTVSEQELKNISLARVRMEKATRNQLYLKSGAALNAQEIETEKDQNFNFLLSALEPQTTWAIIQDTDRYFNQFGENVVDNPGSVPDQTGQQVIGEAPDTVGIPANQLTTLDQIEAEERRLDRLEAQQRLR